MSMAFTRLSRYAGYSGADFVKEASVLQNTLSSGYWNPGLGNASNYQSSLAITILPTITSGIIHVSGSTTFLFQTFFLLAFLPLALHPVINSVTRNFNLATFSSLLLAQNWFFYGQHLIGKTEAALVLCVLSVYCLMHRNVSFRLLGIFFSLGVAMSHYTISLFLVFILFSYFALSKILVPIFQHLPIFRKASPITIRIPPILASVVLMTLWLAFAAPLVLPTLSSSSQQALVSVSNLLSGSKRVDTSLAISSSAGPIVTTWFDLQNGLIGLGGLLMLNRYRRGLVPESLASWSLIGLYLVGLLGAWIVLPYLSVNIESTRILNMIIPFVTVYLGILLLRIVRHPSKLTTIFVLSLILLMVPMNLMLPNQERNSLYHTVGDLPLDKQVDATTTIPTASNYAVADWATRYLSYNSTVEVDSVGRYVLTTASPFPASLNFAQEDFPPYPFHRYSLLSSYFVNDDLWSTTILGATVYVPGQDPSNWFSQPTHNVLYSSPKFWVMSPCVGTC